MKKNQFRYQLLFLIVFLTSPLFVPAWAQISSKVEIQGIVTDEDGVPIPGANVIERGTNNGVVTNFDGNFEINVSPEAVLVMSFVGFETIEIEVDGQNEITVSMQTSAAALDEVVVVGYGTKKKTSLTTAVTAIGGEDLAKQSSTGDLRKSLQGMAPGLTVIDNGGLPGENQIQMQIRGVSSISGSEPLVLVDGQVVQSISNIDPNSVESVSILKDAASTAVYGSRGSNGIILITTKKGKEGVLSINYETTYGFQEPTVLPEFLSTEEFFRFRNVLAANELERNPKSGLPTYTEQEIQGYLVAMEEDPINNPAAAYDLDDVYKPAPQSYHSLTVSGGGELVQTMINASYYQEEGTIWERNYERMNIRANNNITISNALSGHLNLFYQTAERNSQASGHPEFEAVQGVHNPRQQFALGGGVFYDEEGNYLPKAARNTNPRFEADTRYMGLEQEKPRYQSIDAGLNWEPFEDFVLSGSYSVQHNDNYTTANIPRFDVGFAKNNNNSLRYFNQDISRNTLNLLANYEKSLGAHNFSGMLGYANEEFRNETQNMYGQDFFNNEIRDISSGSQENININNNLNEWGLRSYFGRVGYNFAEKYFAEFSLRSDGSSRFPEENRFSQFPGASVAWRISEEPFWEDFSSIVSDFKIRGSYGETGSHAGVGNYDYIPQLGLSQRYGFTTGPGGEYTATTIIQNTMVADELSWERVVQYDLGVDISILRNQLNITFDVFDKTTEGILLSLPVPGVIGLNAANTNAGRIENKGWEFSADWRDNIREFRYNISAGIASVEDRLVDYAGLGVTPVNSEAMYYRWEGSPLFAIRGYNVVGIYQTDAEAQGSANIPAWEDQIGAGDYQYEDVNGDGIIDWENDAQLLGDRTPKYTYNLNLGANWRGFDLNMLWNGAAGVQTVLSGYLGEGGQWNNSPVSTYLRDNYWSEEGDTDVHFSRPLYRQSNNTEDSSRKVHDADYTRLKSLVLGYSLPSSVISRLSLTRVRIYFSGTNLLTLSELTRNWGIDPEDAPLSGAWQGLQGGQSNAARHIYPSQLKAFQFGLNISL